MKEEWRTYRGKGFSFTIPKIYGRNIKTDKAGQWEYGEFLLVSSLGDNKEKPNLEGVFYYWTKKNVDFEEEALKKQCRELAAKFLFESRFKILMKECNKAGFSGFPAMIIKFRFTSRDPEGSGPLEFFIVDNKDQKKVYFLGLLADQDGDCFREDQVIRFIEDKIMMSFKFAE